MTAIIRADQLVSQPFDAHPLGSLLMLRAAGDWTGKPCLALKVGGINVGTPVRADAALIIQGSPFKDSEEGIFIGELMRPSDGPTLAGSVLGTTGVRIGFDLGGDLEFSRHQTLHTRAALGLSEAGPFLVGGMGHGVRAIAGAFPTGSWSLVSETPQAIAWAPNWSLLVENDYGAPDRISVQGWGPARYPLHPGNPRR